MENKCPKCGEKLSFFYIKQNCPHCDCNLLYYNYEGRLEEDALKAEAEYAALSRTKEKLISIFKRRK